MHAPGGAQNGSRLDDQLRLVIVDSPDVAAPLIGALDAADVGAWMWVEAERALYFSPRVLELLGLAHAPLGDVLKRFAQNVHPDDQEPMLGLIRKQRPAGTFTIRYRCTPPDGPLRWIEERGRVERSSSGALVRQGGTMRDVTHEVGRELERREAEARLETLVNAMPFPVWGRSGPNLALIHQNAASIAMWGEMLGQTPEDAPPGVRERWRAQLADVMTGQLIRARCEFADQGEMRTVEEIIAPVIVGDQVTGVAGVSIDVTDEARAARFQALLLDISTDIAGRSIETLNAGLLAALERIARFLGAPIGVLCEVGSGDRAGTLRITHWWVDPATGRDQPRFLDVDVSGIQTLVRRGETSAPLVIRSRDELPVGSEERAWLEQRELHSFATVPTQEIDGVQTLLAFAGSLDTVVTWPADTVACLRLAATLLGGVMARVRADASRLVVERRMQDAQKLESLGALAGGVAHDFNNLLTAILGNASLLRVELNDHGPGTREAIDQIEAASRRAAELCRQMLAYAGRGRFALQLMDVNELIRSFGALLDVTIPKKARLELDLAPAVPPVLADETQLRQLVMNLMLNAVEALEDKAGTITVSTRSGVRTAPDLADTVFSPQLPAGLYVSLRVSDTGTGMPADTVSRIFDPFFTTKFTGRGLGLAAVVGIVRAHKGALRVASRPGAGSSFELILPVHEGQPRASLAPAPAQDTSRRSWRTTGNVLVIDDERGVRELVRNVLERAGLTVIVAENGERGLAVLDELPDEVRLAIVDLTMPGLDGRETLAALRAKQPDLPAVVMSGYSPIDLLDASAQVFLQKPFTPEALRAAVRRALGAADD